jgi:hypothetical protein
MEIPIEYNDKIIMIKRERGENDNYFYDKAYYIAEKIIEEFKSSNSEILMDSKDYSELYKDIEVKAKKMCNEKYLLCKY